jgi:hypothetical protein
LKHVQLKFLEERFPHGHDGLGQQVHVRLHVDAAVVHHGPAVEEVPHLAGEGVVPLGNPFIRQPVEEGLAGRQALLRLELSVASRDVVVGKDSFPRGRLQFLFSRLLVLLSGHLRPLPQDGEVVVGHGQRARQLVQRRRQKGRRVHQRHPVDEDALEALRRQGNGRNLLDAMFHLERRRRKERANSK